MPCPAGAGPTSVGVTSPGRKRAGSGVRAEPAVALGSAWGTADRVGWLGTGLADPLRTRLGTGAGRTGCALDRGAGVVGAWLAIGVAAAVGRGMLLGTLGARVGWVGRGLG